MRKHWPVLVFVAVILVFASLAQTAPGHGVLHDVGLYETPPAYTELTFAAPGKLPSALAKPTASVPVAFGIHNVTGASRDYQWSIVLVHAGKSDVKATGTALVPAQGRAAVTRSVTAACTGGQVQVVVQLQNPAESISFWMTCPPAKKTVKK